MEILVPCKYRSGDREYQTRYAKKRSRTATLNDFLKEQPYDSHETNYCPEKVKYY